MWCNNAVKRYMIYIDIFIYDIDVDYSVINNKCALVQYLVVFYYIQVNIYSFQYLEYSLSEKQSNEKYIEHVKANW